jgi:GcrA cell cycle regulator
MTKKTKKLKTVATLESNDCRWPIGDPRQPEFHFCGAPRAAGRPYCAAHWQMAFQPSKPRSQPAPIAVPDRRAA